MTRTAYNNEKIQGGSIMTLNDIFLRLCDIDRKAQTLFADAGFDYEDGLGCKVCPDPNDPEERFLQ